MIFIAVLLASISFGVGYLFGRARQYHDSRERLRIRVIESNLDELTSKRVTQLLDEL